MENNEAGEYISTQKVLSPNHDPGWNDPPKWSLSGTQSLSGTPTKRLLNKRVAFPLVSTQTTNKEQTPQTNLQSVNMPPPLQSPVTLTTAPHRPSMPPSDKDSVINKKDLEIDKNQALTEAMENLEAVIDEYVTNKNKAEDIRRRLEMMKTAWIEDKLNNAIHLKILELSKALQSQNVERADKIHIALMLQYSNLCSSWIPGIRHIILELRIKLKNSNEKQMQDIEPSLTIRAKEVN